MGRNIRDVIAALPENERAAVDVRYAELRQEVDSLKELRAFAEKAQADVAKTLRIKQPSVSKIEKQSDMLLSTLRGYVEAIGGSLNVSVQLPNKPIINLRGLGDLRIIEDVYQDKSVSKARPKKDMRETSIDGKHTRVRQKQNVEAA